MVSSESIFSSGVQFYWCSVPHGKSGFIEQDPAWCYATVGVQLKQNYNKWFSMCVVRSIHYGSILDFDDQSIF